MVDTTSYLEFPKREFPRSGIAGIPIGIPGSKTALFWEFPGIPIQRGFLCIQRGCFGFVLYQKILKYLYLGSSFAAVVADDTAIRASSALEKRNNEATAREVSPQSPILPIAEFLAS
jgi:hypothetical protein